MNKSGKKVYIAHRAKAFEFMGNTLDSFKCVLEEGIESIEVDVRFSNDGIPFLQHDAHASDTDKEFYFGQEAAEYIQKRFYKDTKLPVTMLEEIFTYFSENKKDYQKILLDIKSCGNESNLVSLIEKYDMFDSIDVVSSAPYVVTKLHEEFKKREQSIPIFFSYVRSDVYFGRLYEKLFFSKKNPEKIHDFFGFVFLNQKNYKEDLGAYKTGHTHIFFDRKGVPDDILAVLQESQGGICINISFRLREFLWAKKMGLQTMVFGGFFGLRKIRNPKRFLKPKFNDYIDYVSVDLKNNFNKFLK